MQGEIINLSIKTKKGKKYLSIKAEKGTFTFSKRLSEGRGHGKLLTIWKNLSEMAKTSLECSFPYNS